MNTIDTYTGTVKELDLSDIKNFTIFDNRRTVWNLLDRPHIQTKFPQLVALYNSGTNQTIGRILVVSILEHRLQES